MSSRKGNSKQETPAKAADAHSEEKKELNPITHHYEFMGPHLGPPLMLLGLPSLVWAASFYCNKNGWPALPLSLPTAEDFAASFSWEAVKVYLAWFFFQAVIHLVVPGKMADGVQLRDGTKLKYRINGWNCLLVTVATAAALHLSGLFKLTWICDNFLQLATASILFSIALSVYLYATSFIGRKLLAEGGNSQYPLYDFFIGRELNPRILGGRLDLKYFCELRPGLFLWLLINTAMVIKQYEATGTVSLGMAFVYALQALYVADSVYNEECILTTMDIIMDGFGFMLAFGDLAWVPFLYSLQCRYLADFPLELSPLFSAVCFIVGVGGFYIFRASNAQKDQFKKDPESLKHLPFIPTARGTKLLAGGWWGVARHINYFGDWLLSLGQSLVTGFTTPITYFYPIYFAVLLIHRDLRDDEKCSKKYGEAWQQYKKKVPYRIVPYVY